MQKTGRTIFEEIKEVGLVIDDLEKSIDELKEQDFPRSNYSLGILQTELGVQKNKQRSLCEKKYETEG